MKDAGIDWDDAFDNSGYVPGSDGLPDQWTADAAIFREDLLDGGRAALDQPYGPGARHRFDLFHPDGPSQGTMMFVHGGFWRMLDKSYWSHFAAGAVARGWSVAMPSYPLAPEARIAKITTAIKSAVGTIADQTEGPIALVGHSAGGHLVARMACKGMLPQEMMKRVRRVVSISGLHHLTPLLQTKLNDTLRLTEQEAQSESPVFLEPVPNVELTVFVGGQERPEFLRQTRMLAEVWSGTGASVRTVYDPGTHHFNVINSLRDPQGALTQEVLG